MDKESTFLSSFDLLIEHSLGKYNFFCRNVVLIKMINQNDFFYSKEVNYEELARCTDDFNGAQLKAVCVEAVRLCFSS